MFPKYFIKFLKCYGDNYNGKILFLAITAFFAGIAEFIGIAMIFPFILILTSSNSAIVEKLMEFSHISDKITLAGFLGIIILSIFILKNIFMIYFTKLQTFVMADFLNAIYSKCIRFFLFSPFALSNSVQLSDKLSIFNHMITASVERFFYKCIQFFVNLIIAMIVISFLFYKFTLQALLVSILIASFAWIESMYFKRCAKKHGEIENAASRTFQSHLNTILNSIKEIKIRNKESFFRDKFFKDVQEVTKIRGVVVATNAYSSFVTEIIILLAIGAIGVFFFCFSPKSPAYLVSSMAVVFAAILRLIPLLNKMQLALYSISSSIIYVKSLIKLYDKFNPYLQDNVEESEAIALPFKNEIVLENVCFSYTTDKQVLKNINFKIKKGEFIGIVGHSGCGKTTLFNILNALYLPDSGSMSVDGVVIKQDNLRSWQKNISIAPQEFFFPPEPVISSVAFGMDEKDIDLNKVENALRLANVLEVIGAQANELSTGQKHRVAVAQALYLCNDFLMFDEATASLDAESEIKVSETISSLKGKKTILVIAHRLSTLSECDKIVFMKEGEIVDIGSFEELRERSAEFEFILRCSNL